jgi:hypothetical protein
MKEDGAEEPDHPLRGFARYFGVNGTCMPVVKMRERQMAQQVAPG